MLEMKKYHHEIELIALSILTYLIWVLEIQPFWYLLGIYGLVFLYLLVFRRPLTDYLVVVLFSVMADHFDAELFLVDYVLIIFLFVFTIGRILSTRQFVMGKLLLVMFIYTLYFLITVLWTPVKTDGLQGMAFMLEGYLLYIILTNSKGKISINHFNLVSKIATFLMLVVTLETITIYWQNRSISLLDMKTMLDYGWGFSNTVAVYYTFLIPVAFYKYLNKSIYLPHYFFFDILNFVGLLLTLSRGALVGVAISMIGILILCLNKFFLKRYSIYLPILAGITLSIKQLRLFIFDVFKTLFVAKDFFEDNGRLELYQFGFKKFLEKPLFGHGMKASKFLIHDHFGYGPVNIHNFILQVALSGGIVGVILLGVLLYQIGKLFWCNQKEIICMGLGLIASLSHQMMDISFDILHFSMLMYSMIGIVEIYRHQKDDDPFKMQILTFNKKIATKD